MDLRFFGLIVGLSCAIVEAEYVLDDLEFLKICHRNDPQLNECVMECVEGIRPYLKHGIEQLNIPPCEPLRIAEIELNQGGGPVTMSAIFSDIELTGTTNFILKNVKIDTNRDVIKLKLYFPRLEMISDYTMDGKILMLPITGTGQARGNYSDIDAKIEVRGKRYQNPSTRETHFRAVNIGVALNVGHATIHLDKMFNGEKTLTDAMNIFLNENWKTVMDEIKPALEETIADLVKNFSNKVYSKYPLNVLLPL